MLKLCYKNILETSTVTLSAGTADSSYPLYRLYDRGIGKVFKTTAAETTEVKIDQGVSGNLAADRLFIPAGHNLDGMTLDILYSDNDADWSPAVTQWVQSGNGQIEKNWNSITHRYSKFKITSPASIPEFAELFLTQTFEFAYDPDFGWGDDVEHNIEKRYTSGGQSRSLVHGDDKQIRNFMLNLMESTEKTNLKAFRDHVKLNKGFYLYDMTGVWYFMELVDTLPFPNIAPSLWNTIISCKQVLPE